MSEPVPVSADAGPDYGGMHGDIVALLEAARHAAARSINALMTASYWEIGRRVVAFEQGGQDRAAYGDALIARLSVDLTVRFGRGFSRQNLWQMRAFHLAWPTHRLSQTLSAKSSEEQILQTASGESPTGQISESASRNFIDLAALAKSFPLPW